MYLRRAIVLGMWLAGASLHAQSDPSWWASGVIRAGDANNYAPINLGQVMNLADQARIHLNTQAGAVGGAGPEIEDMVAGWPNDPATAYSPANLGQLKAIADKFYTRLDALGFDYQTQMVNDQLSAASRWSGTPLRPWTVNGASDSNYAIANIGQAKLLFSWDLTRGLLHAVSTTVTVDEDTMGTITLSCLGTGASTATYQILTNPLNGKAVLSGNVVTYYPKTQFSGTDSFTFKVTSGGQPSTATVSIVVTPVDDAPLVSVGGGKTVTLPGTLALSGAITDYDTAGTALTHTWVKVSGPGDVAFAVDSASTSGNVTTVTTTASFSVAGDYVLRLIATDAHSMESDSLRVRANAAGSTTPTVTMLSLGGLYAPGTAITLQATATVGGGATISKVEFYEGSRLVGVTTTPISSPMSGLYQVSWMPTHWGAYQISAVATTSMNTKGFSSNSVVARVGVGSWFTSTGAGNEGYSGTGGDGGAIAGGTTGPGGAFGPGTGGNGGGNVAGGGGNGTGMGDDEDLDQDGLSFAQEKEAGTNPLPGGEDTDGDGVLDGQDGFPLNKDLKPPRLPDVQYAVIDLTKMGCEESDSPAEVNDKGQLLLLKQQGYQKTSPNGGNIAWEKYTGEFWDPSTQDKTEIPILSWDFDLAESPTILTTLGVIIQKANLLNNEGVVCGIEYDAGSEAQPAQHTYGATWTKDGGTSRLSAFDHGAPSGGTMKDHSSWALAINDNGDVIGASGVSFEYPAANPNALPGSKDVWSGWGPTIWSEPRAVGFQDINFWPAPPRGG